MKLAWILFAWVGMVVSAGAVAQQTPGPLLGAVGGPWGLAAGLLGYGAYRLYKSKR